MPGFQDTRVCAVTLPGGGEPWVRAGFECGAAGFAAGAVAIAVGRPGAEGVRVVLDPPSELDGAGTPEPFPIPHLDQEFDHPNGVVGVDHIVVATPSLSRSRAAMLDAGLDLRLERQAQAGEGTVEQAFFLAGTCVIELVGGPGQPDGPASVWGITFVTSRLGCLPALEGGPVASIKEAVQPGRHIAVARRELGLPTRVAFMDPRTSAGER